MNWPKIPAPMISSLDGEKDGLESGKGLMASILTSLISVVGILTEIGCSIIPCVRRLAQRLTETTISMQMSMTYQQNNFATVRNQI
jgi:hypothetical protein